jgi:tRNA 2-thiouridine synthesizing protein E
MAIDVNGKSIETNENGYLVNLEDWNEDVATALAAVEGLELTQKHWDTINYLRDEYYNNGGNQPNERNIVKAMSKIWGEKVSNKDMYDLFPLMTSKQGGKVAGLPETRRKGGY